MCGYVPGVHDTAAGPETARGVGIDGGVPHVLLAIDTSIGTSVALGVGVEAQTDIWGRANGPVSGQIFEAMSDDARGHTEMIGSFIAEVFERANVPPSRVDGVIVGIGPGPFTGLRIGIAAAKAFAVARGVALMPLQGHEAVALDVLLDSPEQSRVRVVQDAKRRELFVTEYAGLDGAGLPVCSAEAHLLPRADYVEQQSDVWPERIPAARLVQLAARRLAAGRDFAPDRALYLRAPDAKPAAAVKRVSA